MQGRNEMIDSVKGIGMLSVMIGHSVIILPFTHLNIGQFVYLYHVMLFFFVAGFLYDEKYNDVKSAPVYIGKRFLGLFMPFVLYNAFFVLLHNLFLGQALIDAEWYSFDQIVIWFTSGIVFVSNEALLGAFWFLPVLLVCCVLFCISAVLAARASELLHKNRMVFHMLLLLFMLLFSAIGIYTNQKGMLLTYHIQTAFLALPVMYIGWLTKKNYQTLSGAFNWIGGLVAGAMLCALVFFQVTAIELSVNQLGNVWMFYPVTCFGIYFCMCAAAFLQKCKPIHKLLSFIGRYSLHFMALHFLCFKILDLCVSKGKGDPASVAVTYPHAYDLGLLYTVFAVIVIGAGICISKRIFKRKKM